MDVISILTFIDEFTSEIGVQGVQINSHDIKTICVEMRAEFPHVDGLSKASVFKKMANFVAHFLSYSPIKTGFPENAIKGYSGRFDPNAVIALDMAIRCIQGSHIKGNNGNSKCVEHPIYLSDHSYSDIIFSLSQGDIKPKSHYHLLAVFFEQLTYKSNPHCEYKPENGQEQSSSYYPGPHPVDGGDDMAGI